jgi:cell wall-associated NlpC family hydrolase
VAEENNIGASRLIGSNNFQSAVDSLTTQVTKLTTAVSQLVGSMNNLTGSNTQMSGGSKSSAVWNSSSNRTSYSGNGGGGNFSGVGASQSGNKGNGGSSSGFGNSKLGLGLSAGAAVGSALTSYGNKNMNSMMQMNYFGTQSALMGGGTAGSNVAQRLVFANNYAALNVNDAAQAGYINAYTFGGAISNGQANPAFVSGQSQANAFGYVSPTMGAAAAATAAQQTYTARSSIMSQALGIGPTIGAGGVKNSMSSIAQGIYNRTFGSQKITPSQFNAATSQGGSLAVNLQYFGQQLGWNQSTVSEYQNYLQGQVTAQAHNISSTQYATLTQQAAAGNKNAQNTLKGAGIGTSAYQAQMNLNSTQMTRQEGVNESMASAFTKTTNALNNLSGILTQLMNSSGLTKALGIGAGVSSPISNALGGFSGAFGAGAGILGAAKLFGGGGSLLGGLSDLLGGSGVGAAARTASTMGSATQDANGVYKITTLGDTAAAGGGLDLSLGALGAASGFGAGAAAVGIGGHALTSKIKSKKKKQFANFGVDTASGALAGAAVGSVVPILGTAAGAAVGAGIGGLIGIFGGATSSGGVTGNQSGATSTVPGASTANAASVIKFAESQLGVPYVWGGETAGKGFDCSGLTQWAYGKAGVKIPRVAADQQTTGTPVPVNATQPGDLLFMGDPAYHVVMAIGGGKVIEAPHTGSSVNIETLIPSQYSSATRIVGALGNLNSLTNSNSSPNQNTLNNQQNMVGGDIGSYDTSEADIVASALSGSYNNLPLTSNSAAATSGTAQPGGVPTPNGNNSPSALQKYAKALLAKYGWAGQWSAFNSIEMAEAGWNYKATNPSSGAYGLAQALPASKYASAGSDWKTSGDTQLQWMMGYIQQRYGDPNAAWAFHQKNNWYASGAWNIDQDQAAQVHKGEMILPAKQAETVRNAITNAITTASSSTGTTTAAGGISFGDIYVQLPSGYSGSSQDAKMTAKAIVNAMQDELRLTTLKIGQ